MLGAVGWAISSHVTGSPPPKEAFLLTPEGLSSVSLCLPRSCRNKQFHPRLLLAGTSVSMKVPVVGAQPVMEMPPPLFPSVTLNVQPAPPRMPAFPANPDPSKISHEKSYNHSSSRRAQSASNKSVLGCVCVGGVPVMRLERNAQVENAEGEKPGTNANSPFGTLSVNGDFKR